MLSTPCARNHGKKIVEGWRAKSLGGEALTFPFSGWSSTNKGGPVLEVVVDDLVVGGGFRGE